MNTTRNFALLVPILTFSACVTKPPPDEVVNVIAALPLTGPFAPTGEAHQPAIQMAVLDLEKAGFKWSINVEVVDTGDTATAKTRLAEAITRYTNAAGKVNVAAILSSTRPAQNASTPIALQNLIPHLEVSSGGGVDEVLGLDTAADKSLTFAARPLCPLLAKVAADFIESQATPAGWDRLVLMEGDDAHDVLHSTIIRKYFTDKGSALVQGETIKMTNDTASYQAALTEAKTRNPKVIFFHLTGDTNNVNFMRELANSGYTGDVVTCGMGRKAFLENPRDVLSNKFYLAMRGPVLGENLTKFKADYKAFVGKDADTFAPVVYDSMMLVGLALAQLNTAGSDGLAVRDAIRSVSAGGEKVTYGSTAAALEVLSSGRDLDYEGASGPLDFRADNTVPGRFFIERISYPAGATTGTATALPTPVYVSE